MNHAHFSLKLHPFCINDTVKPLWQEFLGCSNVEANSSYTCERAHWNEEVKMLKPEFLFVIEDMPPGAFPILFLYREAMHL